MNLKNILYFTIDGAMSHGARFLWSIVLIGLSMLGIGYFMMFTNNYRYIEEECDRVLKRGISETGVMNVTEYSSYEAKKLKEEAMASGKIECIGTWLSGESGAVPSQELILEQARIGRSTIGENYASMDMSEPELELLDRNIRLLEECVNSARGYYGVIDEKIMNIVGEEAHSFYYEDKALEGVIDVIKNRVKLYVEENGD